MGQNETLHDGHHILFYGTIANVILQHINSGMYASLSIDKTDHSVFLLKVT